MPRRIRWLDESWDDEEKVLEIEWATDVPGYDSSHVTRLSADEIRYPASHFYKKETWNRDRTIWNKSDMDQSQHWVSYHDYMENEDKFYEALTALSQYGLIFIKGIPESRQMVEQLATRLGPLRNSFYGPTWDVRNDPKAKNVAYTNQNLGFHMDLLYMADPPGYQLLHCLKNSCEGGESLFVDAHSAARDLDESSWYILSQNEVPYHYNHEDHYYRTTRPVIEAVSPSKTARYQAIKHINYSPPFQGPFEIEKEQTKSWAPRAKRLILAFKKFAEKVEEPSRIFELKLNPGECVIFENRRVLHARRAFDTTSGERWLAGAYVDEADVNSKMFTMKRKAGAFNQNQADSSAP
jgi:alpha-ketoglutarate-dependent taurine dioxygenase